MAERTGGTTRYDVAVAGGGVVGAATALGLARQGRRVLLVEPAPPERQRGRLRSDIRTVAVSPASRALFDALGVWGHLQAAPYRRMEVWEERGTRAMEFDAGEVHRSELGWIVENSGATTALWDALRDHEQVDVHAGRVIGARPGADAVDLGLPERPATARLLVAADGARSAVRESLGVAVETLDMGHAALATVVRTALPHNGVAFQRFLLDGPLALLPASEPHHSSVVWSQPPESAERRRSLDETAFCRELGAALQNRLGKVEAVDQRVVFPLGQQLAASFNPHPRVLLIGDAARVLHPLAGLGANVGLEDVRELLAVLAGLPAGADPGGVHLWEGFERARRARARLMLGVMWALRQVYARGDPFSQWLRNTGVGWLNQAGPLKRQLMVEAMGLGPVGGGAAGV